MTRIEMTETVNGSFIRIPYGMREMIDETNHLEALELEFKNHDL